MRWEKVGTRNLRLAEISEEEKKWLDIVLNRMRDPAEGLADAQGIAQKTMEDVLERGYLENRRLNATETVAQLSRWCHASVKHQRVKRYAEEASRLLFAGHILPRLIDKHSKTISNAEKLLDDFVNDVLRDQDGYIYAPPDWLNGGPPPPVVTTQEGGISKSGIVGSERQLREHIAHNPTEIEQGLKLIREEYPTEVGRIDVLCKDKNENLVVIELKKGHSGDAVVGQTLRYMGWLVQNENKNVRGIIVLGKHDSYVKHAVIPVPNIKIKYYKVHYEFTDEPPVEE